MTDASPDHEARFAAIYAAFNRRDIPALLDDMTEDVTWPNGWEGGVVHGREQVRDYWERQWSQIDPEVSPLGVHVEPDGVIAVRVHQVVRDRAGALLSEQDVTHAYTLRGELVAEMEIRRSSRRRRVPGPVTGRSAASPKRRQVAVRHPLP